MALQHRISDAIHIRTDKDASGNTVLEIEFKFIRYRLSIDDKNKAEKLSELLTDALTDQQRTVEHEEEMPKFYKREE